MKLKQALILAFIISIGASATAQTPQIDADKPIVCSSETDGTPVRVQCDDAAKICLVARQMVLRDGKDTKVRASRLEPCNEVDVEYWFKQKNAGYRMVPATNDAPYGYTRDERNRLFQTSFDLRNRAFVGAHDFMTFDPFSQAFGIESGVRLAFNGKRKRWTFRFLEGQLSLDPFQAQGVGFAIDSMRDAKRANIWLTTFIGSPKRFDIRLNLGWGGDIARFRVETQDDDTVTLLDPALLRINWDIWHNESMENFVRLYVAGGGGIRLQSSQAIGYLFPEVGLKARWRVGARGLTEIGFDGRARVAFEPEIERRWVEYEASAHFEQVVVAINDQPISLFVRPAIRRIDISENWRQTSAQVLVGGRINFFVPVPDEPRAPAQERRDTDNDGIENADDACIVLAEDVDGFDDSDGCPDLDNDQDGIVDTEDACPLLSGDPEFRGCPNDDIDKDGVPNNKDRCPDISGDGKDGCELDKQSDADNDGLPDVVDKCPSEPEDRDNFQDEDGCPDYDNDGDRVPDIADQCPLEPATGVSLTGCP